MKAKTWFYAMGQRAQHNHPEVSTKVALQRSCGTLQVPGWALVAFQNGYYGW
jgi:hypothetical protein